MNCNNANLTRLLLLLSPPILISYAPKHQQWVSHSTVCCHLLSRANCVPNRLSIAFFSSDHDVGIKFWRDVGLIPSNMVCCKCESQMSWCVEASFKNGYRCRRRRAVSVSESRASLSVIHGTCFSRVTWTSWRFCSSRTSFAAFLLTLSTKSLSSVLQLPPSWPDAEERLCCRPQQARSVTLLHSDKSLHSHSRYVGFG